MKWMKWLLSLPKAFVAMTEENINEKSDMAMRYYDIRRRCIKCDVGLPQDAKSAVSAFDVCPFCGVDRRFLKLWVGKRSWGVWYWVEARMLPDSIRPSDLELLAIEGDRK